MSIIYILIPISLLFVILAIWIFFWSVHDGQLDDLESPSKEIIFQDEQLSKKDINQNNNR